MSEFALSFAFSSRNSLPGLGGLKSPVSPWKEAQFQCSVQGAAAPLLPFLCLPQARPAESESDWLCASGWVILCSRAMSPWLTIMVHSVLLLSTEALNSSLVFNNTAELQTLLFFNPSLSCIYLSLHCRLYSVYFTLSVFSSLFHSICDSYHSKGSSMINGGGCLDWSLPHGHPSWIENIDASLSSMLLLPLTCCPSLLGLSLPEWAFQDSGLAGWD